MRKWILTACIVIFLGALIIGVKGYMIIKGPNVQNDNNEKLLLIPSSADFDDLIDSLSKYHFLKNSQDFVFLSDWMKFDKPKPGRYRLQNGWSNLDLIRHLRSGNQEAKDLTFNNLRTIEDLCGVFGRELESDSLSFLSHFKKDSTLSQLNLNEHQLLSLFLPNTYKIFWNTSPDGLLNRMKAENDKFWNSDRLQKLKKLDLTKAEAYTLASIVQKESNSNAEKPRIAGVYLNRLRRNMLLQADPTVIYAVGDFTIRRVLNSHLETDSPYNTYKYLGLPPGPIYMPDISSIDAVLNAESHNYLYFCVKPGNVLEHAFASTLSQHNANARRYQRWLNQNRIFN